MLSLLFLLLGNQIFVGDRVVFAPTLKEKLYAVEVTEARGDSYGIQQSWPSVRPPLRSWLSVEQMEEALIGFSREHAKLYFDECEANGGLRERATVPAGSFIVCTYFFRGDSRASYSVSPEVPLGIVRRVQGPNQEGAYETLELQEFRFGP